MAGMLGHSSALQLLRAMQQAHKHCRGEEEATKLNHSCCVFAAKTSDLLITCL